MFHAILYFGLTLATIILEPVILNKALDKRSNTSMAGNSAFFQTICNAFITSLIFRGFAFLFDQPGPGIRYFFSSIVANISVFELFYFFGCEICTVGFLEISGRNHESFFRWSEFRGETYYASSLLDIHFLHSIFTFTLPVLLTLVVTGSGWSCNVITILHVVCRQYTRFGWMKKRFS